MTVLILGPSAWLPGKSPDSLESVRQYIPLSWSPAGANRLSPLDVRIALAHLLSSRGVPAIVMESEEPRKPPNSTRKFHDLIRKHRVQDYYVYWPYGAARSGLDIEIGFLLEQMGRDPPGVPGEKVTVFYEDDGANRRAAELAFGSQDRMEFGSLEMGHRTHYYADLIDLGGIAKAWRTQTELIDEVLARASAAD